MASGKVRSAIMITGGVGETAGSEEIASGVREAIARGRERPDGGPVFVGPNSLGAISRPGRYDTLFIPQSRLDKRLSAPARRVALISQSGAFIVSRMSNLETLDPAFAISLGNQIDLSASDVLAAIGKRDDIDAVGIYAEGFNDLDGLALLRNISSVVECGKHVVLYKAGRTEPGRSAAAGHTAAVAGDYDVCQAAAVLRGRQTDDRRHRLRAALQPARPRAQVGGHPGVPVGRPGDPLLRPVSMLPRRRVGRWGHAALSFNSSPLPPSRRRSSDAR